MNPVIKYILVFFTFISVITADQYVSIFKPTGELIRTFGANLANDQTISTLKVAPNGDIWIGRVDLVHLANSSNPNDNIARFSSNGVEQQLIKESTRYPLSIAFLSDNRILFGALLENGSLSDYHIYVYQPAHTTTYFGDFNNAVMDIATTSNDRMFALSYNVMKLWEFNATTGTKLNNKQVNSYLGRHLAIDVNCPSSSCLWAYQQLNGQGDNKIVLYNYDFIKQSDFNLSHIGNPYLGGLEVLPSHNLLTANRYTGVFYELQTDGTVVRTFSIPKITNLLKFTLDNNGNYVIAHRDSIKPILVPVINLLLQD